MFLADMCLVDILLEDIPKTINLVIYDYCKIDLINKYDYIADENEVKVR
jgi:hypothetical protein